MSAIGPGIAALLLGLAGPSDRLAEFPAEAEVIVDALDVFDEPDEASTTPGRLGRGDRVTVRDADRPGWLTIDPPPGSFCWIEQSAIGAADSRARVRVIAARALVRSGHPQARMPGPPRLMLSSGSVVRLLNRPPLILGQGWDQRTWHAIEPPPGDVRHIRAAGVRVDVASPSGVEADHQPVPAIAETRTGFTTQSGEPSTPPEVAEAIAQTEAVHRAILREPVELWRLEGVRHRYEALLRRATDPASVQLIRTRLDIVARHQSMAQDARLIETLLERSRRRDAALALDQRRLADAQTPQARPYTLEGLIQPSSRKVDGQRVFALIGRDGTTQAYLDIPPGIEVKKLLTHRVGVRGAVHYNEALRARLISVRELEPLDTERETLSGN